MKYLIPLIALLTLATTWHKPYTNVYEFVDYWKDSEAMYNYEIAFDIPQEVIIAKMWMETHGGQAGAGKRGALFGIKGKGIKGIDQQETWQPQVEYQYYKHRWEAISHFCKLIQKELYERRYCDWKEARPDLPDWQHRLLSLQVAPLLIRSQLAYASCGCEDGRKKNCYQKRLDHAFNSIEFVIKYMKN